MELSIKYEVCEIIIMGKFNNEYQNSHKTNIRNFARLKMISLIIDQS